MANGKLDGGQLAILNARFEGVARKMSNTLLRTGRSGVLNRARDFSCCIVTGSGSLLSAADSLPRTLSTLAIILPLAHRKFTRTCHFPLRLA